MKEKKVLHDHVLLFLQGCLAFQEKLLKRIQADLKGMPTGSICRKQVKSKTYYYQYTKDKNGIKNQRYLKAAETGLTQALIKKHCIKKCEIALRNNIPMLKTAVERYRPVLVDFQQDMLWVLEEWLLAKDENIAQWKAEPYQSLQAYEEYKTHTTSLGERMRSKSEVIIAGILEANGIPYRYEAALVLGSKTYYPDFTILCPTTGRLIYWEHFGMMGESKYKDSAEKKMQAYIKSGLYPYDNLIFTFDQDDQSIDATDIQNRIDLIVLK